MQVRQVENVLRRHYIEPGLIQSGDLADRTEEQRQPRLLSRALTAQAVRIVTGLSRADAALTVIDGMADQGIDAIAVVREPQPHVYVVQAKWHKNGRAHDGPEAVQKMAAGLRLIDRERFTPFNPRGQQLAEEANELITSGPVKVTQVYALMRPDAVGDGFMSAIADVEYEFNYHGPRLDHRILLTPELWESAREDLKSAPIEIQAELFPWFSIGAPYESFQGIVRAQQVADWYEHGPDLFNLNIRNPLGRTAINNELVSTLEHEPANFWYFNNGVTILCDSVDRNTRAMVAPHDVPVDLTLHGASVVNGAQTVKAVAEAVRADPTAGSAKVGVRIIVTGAAGEFARRTTHSTNRQNRVESRDFVALDPVQGAIADEMRADLDLEYRVRRSEEEPQGDAGCSVVEAAVALVCLQPDVQYVARIAASREPLWDQTSTGIYPVIFTPRPSVDRLWRAVQVVRAVRTALRELRSRYEGRGAALVDHGTYLLAHLTFRSIDLDLIDEPGPTEEWLGPVAEQVPGLVGELVPRVVGVIDDLYGERSMIRAVCGDVERCREVVERVLSGASEGSPAVADRYRRTRRQKRPRRPNTVAVLLDNDVLPEGEPLVLVPGSSTEVAAISTWLAEDERRTRATWVSDRAKPILWAADGVQYSPSGLVMHMWKLAPWEGHPVATQGTGRWAVETGDTLADLAQRTLADLEATDEAPESGTDVVADPRIAAFVETVRALLDGDATLLEQVDNNEEDQFLHSPYLREAIQRAVFRDDGVVLDKDALDAISSSAAGETGLIDELVRLVGASFHRSRRQES